MIIADIDDQMHIWVRCCRSQTLDDGRAAHRGHRYFVLFSWANPDCGPCSELSHVNCKAGGLEFAGLDIQGPSELFCAADFEPIQGEEAEALMASLIKSPAGRAAA
jgi:hypothetical protein